MIHIEFKINEYFTFDVKQNRDENKKKKKNQKIYMTRKEKYLFNNTISLRIS